ncbi:SHOCT domain-containing protein [Kibdelosporangium lantanae]|uniref:SHOCT domain-containing protein n=1 Tax=Kibdelosporangium lantanae TaxID=1497396 RepID=A0ABW3MI14_9PSEU
MDGYYGDWVGLVFMIAIMAVVIALVMVIGLTVWRHADRRYQQGRPRSTVDSPEELLAMRFARGEIDEKEYRQRREVLRQ